jgi:hypothetical protein
MVNPQTSVLVQPARSSPATASMGWFPNRSGRCSNRYDHELLLSGPGQLAEVLHHAADAEQPGNPATIGIPTSRRDPENELVHRATRLAPSINRNETS